MPRWLVLLAVVGLIFAVMTPATPAASAYTGEAFSLFDHDGPISLNGATDVATAVAIPDDGKFVQMAPGSSIIMTLPVDRYALPDGNVATPDLVVDIYDAAFPAFAEVWLSPDGVNYWLEGLFDDTANINLDLGEIVKYVKIIQPEFCVPGIDGGYCIDQAYPSLGFDLDAVLALNPGVPLPTTSCGDDEGEFVNSYGIGDATPVVDVGVDDGHWYDITASGWFYAGGWAVPGGLAAHDIRADAEYSETRYARVNALGWTDTPGTAVDDPYVIWNYAEDYFELLVGTDGTLASVEWGAYETSHEYTISREATTDTMEFQFQINEGYAQNDTGGLCVALHRVDRAPVADPNGPYLEAVDVGIVFDGSGSSDPDGDDLTYDWDFGDGTVVLDVGATPVYAYSGGDMYNVCLTVTDTYGLTDTECTTAVVYDPSEGFVTGGGWIDSPAGAYTDDPLSTGKATFGFVSKYKKGASVPTGNTEFQFHAGDLNFHSTSYDWLVVTGSNYAKFKGTGTINGEGEYKFQIWAGDNDPDDTFRIKIWYEDGGEIVVYDNGHDQAIGAGSIIIHTKKK